MTTPAKTADSKAADAPKVDKAKAAEAAKAEAIAKKLEDGLEPSLDTSNDGIEDFEADDADLGDVDFEFEESSEEERLGLTSQVKLATGGTLYCEVGKRATLPVEACPKHMTPMVALDARRVGCNSGRVYLGLPKEVRYVHKEDVKELLAAGFRIVRPKATK